MPSQSEVESLKAKYAAAGQEHLFSFYEELEPQQQESLFSQLANVDIERVNRIFKKAISGSEMASSAQQNSLEPLPDDVFDSILEAEETKKKKKKKKFYYNKKLHFSK
ncbi:hypothetical protein Glove_465g67 [Diversispora epigaea]|uniref:Uncharacterized protein n=1 Tax=Diversispora epigaea TaxID=1348612 RepID=A0A397GQZ9_9GLOM|nr:hypothetical protein Glove_465g67 [Diversispora epigaea]